jgi:speckle-type POZ protein
MSKYTETLKLLEFTWEIANYSQQKFKSGKLKWIHSPSFSLGCDNDMKFTLYFDIRVNDQSSDSVVQECGKWGVLFLKVKSTKNYSTCHFEASVLDANGEKFTRSWMHEKIPFDEYWIFEDFIRLSDLENPANQLLPNDTLTICCRVEKMDRESEECTCVMEQPQIASSRRQLAQHLTTLLDDKFADFFFKVQNVKIPAHKAILSARSPVFAAMFQHNTAENEAKQLKIEDTTPDAFRALLKFIYTGQCDVGMLTDQLIVAATKYGIQDLKEICAKEMRKNLTVDNAVEFLILSDLHKANDLKEGAMLFINKNAPAVMKKPSWTDLKKTNPNLIVELFCKLFETS